MIWGELPIALERHENKYLLGGCTNGVLHGTGNTASTTPMLHETRMEANKADSMPCRAGYECVGRSGLFFFFKPQYLTHIGVRPAHMLAESCERECWLRA